MRTWNKGIRRGIAMTLCALAGLLVAPHQSIAAAPIALGDIYNNSSITTFEIGIPDQSVAALASHPKDFTAATVRMLVGSKDSGVINLGVRFKGSTSLDTIAGRPSLKLKFNFVPGFRFLGLKNMTLNAMQQDGSKLHEFGAYALFNAMGQPASKTGWARVYINGVDKGLYLNVETIDDIFLSKRFTDNTQHLYEGQALNDFKVGNADGDKNSGKFLVDEGWKKVPNKNDLNTMINALSIKDNAKWWSRLNTYWNRAELINHMAIENFLGHWDGYSGPIINNYFIRSNPQGKFVMIPWGLDQTFGENRNDKLKGLTYSFSMLAAKVGFPWSGMFGFPKTMDRGMLYMRCIAYTPCKIAYLKALKAVSAKATSMKLVAKMKAAAALTSSLRVGLNAAITTNTYNFVALQQAAVAKLLKANKIK